jgi:hypothetical protein
MLKSRMCFPRAASCKLCLASVKRATRGHARCNLGNPIPTAGGIRVLSFRTCSDKLRGPGTSSTRRCRTVCIPYEEKLSTLPPLLTVTHFMDPAILQTVVIKLYGNTYWASISESQNTLSPRRNAHQCLIYSLPLPKDRSQYIHSTKRKKYAQIRSLDIPITISHLTLLHVSVCKEPSAGNQTR